MARDLAGFEARILDLLMDATHVVFATAQVDEGLRQALDEYTRASLERGAVVRPNEKIATLMPAANWREVSLSTLTGLLNVARVWFPYYAGAAYYAKMPAWVDFELWWNAGAATLFLDMDGVPDGVALARVFYNVAHALKDLDGAAATTFDAQDDSLLVLGAAGWCCLGRATEAIEIANTDTDAVKRYGDLGRAWLAEFHRAMTPKRVARSRGM